MSSKVDRRDFLKVMGVTGAAAGAALSTGCYPRSPGQEDINSRVQQPAEQTPSVPISYATTWPFGGGMGVQATTREGRVIKLEGNPEHPLSLGALSARGQAEAEALYSRNRLGKVMIKRGDAQEASTWTEAIESIAGSDGSKVAWLTGEISDSDAELIDRLQRAIGGREAVSLRLQPEAPLAKAANDLFGFEGVPEFDFAAATALVSFAADFTETWGNPVSQTRGYAKMHGYRDNGSHAGKATYVGPRQSTTASSCDKWIRLAPGLEAHGLRILLAGILSVHANAEASAALSAMPLAASQQAVGEAAAEIRALGAEIAHSDAPLVIANANGPDGDLATALALLATHVAGGSGTTVKFPDNARAPRGSASSEVAALLDAAKAGEIEVLFVHSANPVFMIPGAAEALADVKVVVLGTQSDETAVAANVVLPIHHWLEDWGFHRASADTLGVIQPAMLPVPKPDRSQFFDSKPFGDAVIAIADALGASMNWPTNKAFVEDRLIELAGGAGHALHEAKRLGVIKTEADFDDVSLRSGISLGAASAVESGIKAHIFPHPYLFDGSGADKSWLQETPETTTAVVWGSWAEINPETAAEMGVGRGDAITLSRGGQSITVPVLPLPQTMKGVISVPIGQGHTAMGEIAAEAKGDNPLRLAADGAITGFAVQTAILHGEGDIVRTTEEQDQRGRHIARAVPMNHAEDSHLWHKTHETHYDFRELDSMYGRLEGHPDSEEKSYNNSGSAHTHGTWDWAMSIDLDACVGCGACVVACQSENNIPAVGREKVRAGREMSWITVHKYHSDAGAESDDTRFLVNLCQQCHSAPCEPVCPVHAAYHTHDGLNGQVYNRCVGTRYCSNNCTYKVRRFNWFDYTVPYPENLGYNPDVTVRERGVMEKCTFCVQRTKQAREAAKRENNDHPNEALVDGSVVTACQQTCPAQAIRFGNFTDSHSAVRSDYQEPRAYALLSDLGTKPSVTYLKRVLRNEEHIHEFEHRFHLGGGHGADTSHGEDNHDSQSEETHAMEEAH